MADTHTSQPQQPNAALRRRCRQIAHHLRPVVQVGDGGLSTGVLAELDRALCDHELIKVKLAGDRALRSAMADTIADELNAHVVQQIGAMLVLLRRQPEPNAKLSNLLRYSN